MDPRVKLLILILFDVFVILKEILPLHLIVFSILVFSGFFTDRKRFFSFSKGFIPMMITIFIIGYVFISLEEAILLSLRFSELIIGSYIFFHFTDADEIAKALLGLKFPYNFVFIFTSAIRYVELVRVKFHEIKEAQQGRGIEIKLRNFHAILIPLIVGIFVLADELAEALESRGFTCKNRTFYEPLKWKFRDTVVSLSAVFLFFVLILLI